MTTYVVAFEINDPARRNRFKEALKGYELYCPINENTWAIAAEKSAVQVRDELMKVSSAPDSIFIIRSGTEAAWSNAYGEKNAEWLKKWL